MTGQGSPAIGAQATQEEFKALHFIAGLSGAVEPRKIVPDFGLTVRTAQPKPNGQDQFRLPWCNVAQGTDHGGPGFVDSLGHFVKINYSFLPEPLVNLGSFI